MPSRAMLNRLWQEVALARDDAEPALRLGEYDVRRYQGRLWWSKRRISQRGTQLAWACVSEPLILPAELGTLSLLAGGELRAPQAHEAVSVRFRLGGYCTLSGVMVGAS